MATREQRVSDTEGSLPERIFRRSGTLNELESGTRHARLDSPARSQVTLTQHTSSTSPATMTEEPKTYTLGQAFFIVAGGLAIETKSFRKEPYLTVTPAGAVELARLGLLSPVEEEVINDKTKADPITKALVCVQAAWFIVQCVARVAQNLPLTLLEIHTLAHVFIAILMYLFWFSKPYNALSPLVITDPEAVQTAALFALTYPWGDIDSEVMKCVLRDNFDTESIMKAHFGPLNEDGPTDDSQSLSYKEGLGPKFASDPQKENEHDLSGAKQPATEQVPTPRDDRNDTFAADLNMSIVYHRDTLNASPTSQSKLDNWSEEVKVASPSLASEQGIRSPEAGLSAQPQSAYQNLNANGSILEQQPNEPLPSNVYTSSVTKDYHVDTTLALAQLGVQRLRAAKTHFTYFQDLDKSIQLRSPYLVPVIADFSESPGCRLSGLSRKSKNNSSLFSSVYDLLPSGPGSVWIWLLFISYGAFHLSAWNLHFPTTIERWMWRGAGLMIVASPVLILIPILMVLPMVIILPVKEDSRRPSVIRSSTRLGLEIGGLPLLIATAASRLFLLVEAFVTLRAPAPRIYETVGWTEFWPHG